MDYELARMNMVENQIRANRVTDIKIIEAFKEVPRENFVPSSLKEVSYNDEDIHLVKNRYMMKPMILARSFQFLSLKGNENVLHIGSNTGYASAILSRLCSAVISIESDKKLYEKSISNLTELSFDNVVPLHGPMENGVPKESPFDVIFIEGSIEEKPNNLFNQLNENGKLIVTLRPYGIGVGKANLFFKINNEIGSEELFDAQANQLPIFKNNIKFSF